MCTLVNMAQHHTTVYKFELHGEIDPTLSYLTEQAIEAAELKKVNFILIDIDTYGGAVADADKIRTSILRTKIPTLAFIKNNAASAGALISIACDSIYMHSGATIGAAVVVNGQGEPMPEKYQSYMRKKMRATAEETGRNPLIAEGMTDADIVIDSIKEKGKIITLSTEEAIKVGYCNARINDEKDILKLLSPESAELITNKVTIAQKLMMIFLSPFVSGILLLVIFAGIYFEFKAPGTLFPIAVSMVAAIFYFAPLYIEGLAQNWEVLLFIIGLILLGLEVFVIPGFGITGISGIIFIVSGLTLALIRNIDFDFTLVPEDELGTSFLIVTVAMIAPLIFLFLFGNRILKTTFWTRLSAGEKLSSGKGYSIAGNNSPELIGQILPAVTDLRPAGKIELEGVRYDAISEGDFIKKDAQVKVIRRQGNYWIVTTA
jgi:membrane-bound serine protease (ClpP class)